MEKFTGMTEATAEPNFEINKFKGENFYEIYLPNQRI